MASQLSKQDGSWWVLLGAYRQLYARFYPISVRVRTGVIFLTGLSILILTTVVVTTMVSRAVTRDGVVLAKLGELHQELKRWNGSLAAGSDAPDTPFSPPLSFFLPFFLFSASGG